MSHPLSAHFGPGDLDAAAIADHAFIANSFIFTAVALPVLGGSEDLLAKQAFALRLQRPVIDGLWLLDLTAGPRTNLFRGGQRNSYIVKVVHIQHSPYPLSSSLCSESSAASEAKSSSSSAAGRVFLSAAFDAFLVSVRRSWLSSSLSAAGTSSSAESSSS